MLVRKPLVCLTGGGIKYAKAKAEGLYGIGPEDYRQAEFLVDEFDGRWRFDHSAGQAGGWHRFSPPGIWFPDKVKAIRKETADAVQGRIKRVGLDPLTPAETKQIIKLYNIRSQDAAHAALASFPEFSTTGADWDQRPELLGCANGIVDLTTGTIREGRPDDLVTRSTGITFDPDAECPSVDAFLSEVFTDHDGNEQPELVEYILTVFGAALFGHTAPEQFWLFLGPGGAGKGTLARLVGHVLGGEANYATYPASTLYHEDRFPPAAADARADLIVLKGKRFAYISEPVSPFDDLMLFNHTGNDNITARTLHSGVMLTWTPTHTIIFSSNHAPNIKEVGVNMRRRLRVVPFVRSFGDKPDTELRAKLEAESEGFLALLVRHAVRYAADRHILDLEQCPEVVRSASREFIEANDPLTGFVRDHVRFVKGHKVTSEKLHEAYVQWHARSDRDDEELSQVKFSKAMTDANQHQFRKDRDTNPSRTMTYFGIELVNYAK